MDMMRGGVCVWGIQADVGMHTYKGTQKCIAHMGFYKTCCTSNVSWGFFLQECKPMISFSLPPLINKDHLY